MFCWRTFLSVMKFYVVKGEVVMVRYIWNMFWFFIFLFFVSYCLFFVFECACTMDWYNDNGLVLFLQGVWSGWLFFVVMIYDMAKYGHRIDELQMQRLKMKKYEIL